MMHIAEPLLIKAVADIALCSLNEWALACAARLDAGDRILTLFGRPDGAAGQLMVTTVLQDGSGQLSLLRASARGGEHYPALTPRYPAVQIFERELWEQTGIVPVGHPWLKPVRYEGARQQHMKKHPFFSVRGRDVHEVGVGPIHASVIEPGHFRFMCLGEQVHHLEIQLGYQHRGVEALLLQRPPLAMTTLVESIVGDSSIAYAWGYCAAIEALGETQIALEAELARGVALELERVIAFLQGGATYGRLRTAIINASMRCCGSRFGRGWLRPGGVRFGLSDALRSDLIGTLAAFAKDIAEVNDLMLGARSVQSRFQGVGIVSKQAAREIGLLGLVARASGLELDTRVCLPGRVYGTCPVPLLTEETGDCWARLRLRMREIDASVAWLMQVLQASDRDLNVAPPMAVQALRPNLLCVSLREGFRGPALQVVETDAQGGLLHYKVQDPSLLNWFGLALALRNNEISDFPICNKSFDLSYCGNDL
jgi:Ni,Fe-hydrogenase III large subunit